jgi:hypothetical protein
MVASPMIVCKCSKLGSQNVRNIKHDTKKITNHTITHTGRHQSPNTMQR